MRIIGLIAGICALAGAQTLNLDSLPRPAVPADPLELVTAAAQQVQTPEQRLAATTLLTHARDLSNVRAQPYDLKTSFVSTGSLPSDGSWTMEDVSIGKAYRWTAQGPNYAGITVYPGSTQGLAYSNQAGGSIPLRLKQLREAIFFVNPPIGPQASIRIASGYLNGAAQNCVLNVTGAGGRLLLVRVIGKRKNTASIQAPDFSQLTLLRPACTCVTTTPRQNNSTAKRFRTVSRLLRADARLRMFASKA